MWLNKNFQRWYFAWENLRWSFCDAGCCFSFIFCSSFCCCSSFISRLLCHASGTPPCLLRPVKASTSSEVYPGYFWLPLLFHLPWALRFWVGIFYPQAFFYLTLFPWHFWFILRLSRPPWEPAVLPWSLQGFMLILEAQTRPICLFDSQQSTIPISRRIRS